MAVVVVEFSCRISLVNADSTPFSGVHGCNGAVVYRANGSAHRGSHINSMMKLATAPGAVERVLPVLRIGSFNRKKKLTSSKFMDMGIGWTDLADMFVFLIVELAGLLFLRTKERSTEVLPVAAEANS